MVAPPIRICRDPMIYPPNNKPKFAIRMDSLKHRREMLMAKFFNPFIADPIKALHFAILV